MILISKETHHPFVYLPNSLPKLPSLQIHRIQWTGGISLERCQVSQHMVCWHDVTAQWCTVPLPGKTYRKTCCTWSHDPLHAIYTHCTVGDWITTTVSRTEHCMFPLLKGQTWESKTPPWRTSGYCVWADIVHTVCVCTAAVDSLSPPLGCRCFSLSVGKLWR